MAASQGWRGQAGARLSTLGLFNNTKRGGVGWSKGEKWVVGWWLGIGRGAPSLTPHHLLPRLSEDRVGPESGVEYAM